MCTKVNSELLLNHVSNGCNMNVVIKVLPAKFKALKHSLMKLRHPDQLFHFPHWKNS